MNCVCADVAVGLVCVAALAVVLRILGSHVGRADGVRGENPLIEAADRAVSGRVGRWVDSSSRNGDRRRDLFVFEGLVVGFD
jgi:hypothetical protein